MAEEQRIKARTLKPFFCFETLFPASFYPKSSVISDFRSLIDQLVDEAKTHYPCFFLDWQNRIMPRQT